MLAEETNTPAITTLLPEVSSVYAVSNRSSGTGVKSAVKEASVVVT